VNFVFEQFRIIQKNVKAYTASDFIIDHEIFLPELKHMAILEFFNGLKNVSGTIIYSK